MGFVTFVRRRYLEALSFVHDKLMYNRTQEIRRIMHLKSVTARQELVFSVLVNNTVCDSQK